MSNPEKSLPSDFSPMWKKISFSAALASLVGKYIRELYMEGIRRTLDISTNISAYHDSKTTYISGIMTLEDFRLPAPLPPQITPAPYTSHLFG